MDCKLCGSSHQAELPAEMIIHFAGLEHLHKPGVWVFPKLLVCEAHSTCDLATPRRP